MTADVAGAEVDPVHLDRFRLLAGFIAGRPVEIVPAPAGQAPYTDGRVIFVSAGGSVAEHRQEVLLQSALLGAGSLDPRLVKGLQARPSVARRYLALEGHRVLVELAGQIPLAAALRLDGEPATATPEQSLERARGRGGVADPPAWFGVIKPSRLLSPSPGPGGQPTEKEMRLEFDLIDLPEADEDDDNDDEDQSSGGSKILKLFENPLINSKSLSDYFRKLFGSSRSPGEGAAGAEMQVRAIRAVTSVGPNARPLPSRIRFTDAGKPGAAAGVGGALYPEWDVHNDRYKAQWCRVINFPMTSASDVSAAGVPQDDVLRRRLSRVGLGPQVLRGRADGDELDVEALIEMVIDVRSGFSPAENVYLERRRIARDLGVLILVDASGSGAAADADGLTVHDHQRRAAATLAMTLEELGDRVAVYACRSQGRNAVSLAAIKTFDQRFGALGRARLNELDPSGYTRLGACIRGAADILKTEAGTPNQLLLVLSDGFPYDDGYEGQYAEADVTKALAELRDDGMASLCLSIGSATSPESLQRIFGAASHSHAATLAELSPVMDELFLSSLRQLAAPRAQ
jgi:nitric oxide reductase NorD protein